MYLCIFSLLSVFLLFSIEFKNADYDKLPRSKNVIFLVGISCLAISAC